MAEKILITKRWDGNERKSKVLGMPFGTAMARLRKAIMFDMAKRLGLLSCFRCQCAIERIEDFTIDHKLSWQLDTIAALESFFSLDNIAFSHSSCNSAAAAPVRKKWPSRRVERVAESRRHRARNGDAINARRRELRRLKKSDQIPT